jgi:murein DD-endopeptidase MepM/ murein hydrolase activator NlpD
MLIDSPVGTPAERATGQVWPGRWYDFTPFGMRYELRKNVWARHTGADLNLPGNADAGAIIYAIADGVVTASKLGAGSWGWIIVIEHKDDNGKAFYSRYAHVNHIQFQVARKNDRVTLGSAIALVGNGDGIYLEHGHHLHFDISHTQVLKNNPEHWPGDVEEEVIRRNYSEPRKFILENRTQPTIPEDSQFETMKVVATSLRIRPEPNMTFPEIGWLNFEDVVQVAGSISANGYHFALLVSINNVAFDGRGYIAREFLNAVA